MGEFLSDIHHDGISPATAGWVEEPSQHDISNFRRTAGNITRCHLQFGGGGWKVILPFQKSDTPGFWDFAQKQAHLLLPVSLKVYEVGEAKMFWQDGHASKRMLKKLESIVVPIFFKNGSWSARASSWTTPLGGVWKSSSRLLVKM